MVIGKNITTGGLLGYSNYQSDFAREVGQVVEYGGAAFIPEEISGVPNYYPVATLPIQVIEKGAKDLNDAIIEPLWDWLPGLPSIPSWLWWVLAGAGGLFALLLITIILRTLFG